MKTNAWILAGIIAGTLALAGCAKQLGVDPAPIEKSFASAEAAAKVSADKAVTAIKAGDYAGAMTELKTLAGNAKLTPEQQQAIKDVMAQVQQAVADAAAKVKGDASKAMGDMQKTLPK
jgi:hypothetical protein